MHHQRERLLRRLARLETARAMGPRRRDGRRPGSWSLHTKEHPSPQIVTAYVEVLVRVLPDLAWDAEDRAQRTRLLAAVHEAYADENLRQLRLLRVHAKDHPPVELARGMVERRMRLHVAWLEDRLAQVGVR